MGHKLAIDFGTTNSVVARCDTSTASAQTLDVKPLSTSTASGAFLIPTLLYVKDGRTGDVKEAESDLYLFNLLREVRKEAADRFMQSGNLICPDKILREVARLKPRSKAEMLSINGFNSRMFNKLGNDFLEAINSYKPEVLFKSENKISRELPHNIIETKKLLKKKYTLKEIAETPGNFLRLLSVCRLNQ